jgi:hypothetical protein
MAQSRAFAAVTETLLSEDFSEGATTFPPTNWNDNSGGGWYWSQNGNGDYNGSAVVNVWNCVDAELTTPIMDASLFTGSSDTAFVEFDLWSESDFYSANYGGDELDLNLYNADGSTQVLTLNSATDFTYDNSSSFGYYSDPLTTTDYWRHYKIGIPATYRTSSLQVGWHGYTPNDACGGNFAIDNVTVWGTHYNTLAYTPTAINFGGITLGDTSKSISVLLSNPNTDPVLISGVQVAGADAADYIITYAASSVVGGTMSTPGLDSITIVFTPHQGGVSAATVNFMTSADIPTSVSVNLGGKGLQPFAVLTPTELFRGTTTKLGDTLTQAIVVTNSSSGLLIISPTSYFSGYYPGEYTLSRIPTQPIAQGASDTILVSYTPTMEGSHPAMLNVFSNASDDSVAVQLLGIGTLPRLAITPGALNFDSVALGSTQTHDLTLSNPGTDTLLVKNIYFSYSDGDFSFKRPIDPNTAIAPGASVIVEVSFTPLATGTRLATIRVTTNIPMTFEAKARDTSGFDVQVIGNAYQVGRLSLGSNTDVDTAIVNTQVCQVDTLFNFGSADLLISSASITGLDSVEFSLSGLTLPFTVPANGYQTFSVCAEPAGRGIRTADLTINASSDGQTETSTLPIAVYGEIVCGTAAPSAVFSGNPVLTGTRDSALIVVQNCGDITAIYSATITSKTGAYTLNTPTSIPTVAGGFANFTVYFAPSVMGADTGSVVIVAPNLAPMIVELNGSGGAVIIQATTPTVPETAVGDTSAVFTVTLNNTGNLNWVPGTPVVNNANFEIVSLSPAVISAGSQGTMTLKFTPIAVGLDTASATFPTGTPTPTPQPVVMLSGIGDSSSASGVQIISASNGYVLDQNYPNPFTPSTMISFTTPKEATVQIRVTDVRGAVIRSYDNLKMSAGNHSMQMNAEGLPSGVYYYTLKTSDVTLIRRMMLIR